MRFVGAVGVAVAAVLLGCSADNGGGGGLSLGTGAAGSSTERGDRDAADDADGGACAAPSGSYEALYTSMSGNCGPLTSLERVRFDAPVSEPGIMHIEQLPGSTVSTQLEVLGCAVRMTQTVESDGLLRMRVIADDLAIGAGGEISGTASVTRFDVGGGVTCMGQYDLVLVSTARPIGAAAQ